MPVPTYDEWYNGAGEKHIPQEVLAEYNARFWEATRMHFAREKAAKKEEEKRAQRKEVLWLLFGPPAFGLVATPFSWHVGLAMLVVWVPCLLACALTLGSMALEWAMGRTNPPVSRRDLGYDE